MLTIDRSPGSTVAVCGCGAREVFASRAAVDTWLRDHLVRAHGDDDRRRVTANLHERSRRN